MDIYYFKSPLGPIKVKGDAAGVREVRFEEAPLNEETKRVPKNLIVCVEELQQYFAGNRKSFHFKMNLEGSEFQLGIWALLLELPFGCTLSYLKLARLYGNIKAVRAVAAAVGKNPILVAVPCHRIIGSDGTLVGYAGGMKRKEKLLALEGFPVQTSLI